MTTIVTSIEFRFDRDALLEQLMDGAPEDIEFTDIDLLEYARQLMHDDIAQFYKYNELYEVIHAEVVND